ncbi:MAG TPA: tetratricopeptide repeat protein [Candidatus Polarisedimenticolia bacterium]|nr:tetratricopeptide repeat protein [Candidatus Polarisedimenticolia bacterium]
MQAHSRKRIANAQQRSWPHPAVVGGFFILLIMLQMLAPAALGPFAQSPRPSVQSCLACTESSDLDACHRLAMQLSERNDHLAAITIEERIHALRPDDPEVAAALARMHHIGRNDTIRAIALYHAALGARSGYAPALFGLGNIFEEKGDLDIAEGYFSRGSREHPNMAAFKVRLAAVLVDAGRDLEAGPVLNEILARWPDSDEAHLARRLLDRTALARP